MLRVILGGQWRNVPAAIHSLQELLKLNPGTVHIGSPEVWELNIPHQFVKTEYLSNTIFEKSTHVDKKSYIWQWSALYQCYEYFKPLFNDEDIIIKLRNDLIYSPFKVEPLPNTLSVPEVEFHMQTPFDKKILCNDQIVYGNKGAMSKYFQLPFNFNWGKGLLFETCPLNYDSGIEAILRSHIYQSNLSLSTFPLNYKRG